MSGRKDNLELYINDVFEKECVFTINQEEVEFIQNGVENLAERIVNEVFDNLSKQEKIGIPRTNLRNSGIIKVGSFYEGTKNCFPDEFDIIFCYYEEKRFAYFTAFPVTDVIKEVCNKNRRALKYHANSNRTQKIEFEKYLEHGPATWLRFIYTNKSGEKICINVDLVPAGRMLITEGSVSTVTEICQVPPFLPEIMSTGSYLLIEDNYSFTETEAHFMKNKLSANHKKVYRVLKRLINGHSTENVYKDKTMSCYTSYVIKSIMIIHHFRCTRTADSLLGSCLLEVLEQLLTYEYDTHLPKLVAWRARGPSIVPEDYYQLFLRKYLEALIIKLKSMQSSEHEYSYDGDRVEKSLLEQYLEENGEGGMNLDFNICSIL